MTASFDLLACHVVVPETVSAEQRDQHVARLVAKIDAALTAEPAALVVLPELSTIDYSRPAFGALDVLAEDLDGPSVQAFAALAMKHFTTIVFGMPRRTDTGYRIAQVMVGPEGRVIGHYDKIHVCQYGASMEKEYFERGEALCVFEVAGLKVAPIICYDIRIPELSRTLSLDHGADLILHCGAYARDPSFFSWHQFAMTRALENQVFFLSLNRAGSDWGDSAFYPPWVDETERETSFGIEERFHRLAVDPGRLEVARRVYAFRQDRLQRYDDIPVMEP